MLYTIINAIGGLSTTHANHTDNILVCFWFLTCFIATFCTAGKPGARRTGHRTSQRGADLTSTPVQRASTNVVLANKDVSSQVTTGMHFNLYYM